MSQKIYPIRKTRQRWTLNLYGIHECTERCKYLFYIEGNILNCKNNESYIENKCNRTDTIEKSHVHLSSFDINNPRCLNGKLCNGDDKITLDPYITLVSHVA